MQNALRKTIIASASALTIAAGIVAIPGSAMAVGKGTDTFQDEGFYGGYGWGGYGAAGYAAANDYGACGPAGYGQAYPYGYAPGNWGGCGEAPYGYYR